MPPAQPRRTDELVLFPWWVVGDPHERNVAGWTVVGLSTAQTQHLPCQVRAVARRLLAFHAVDGQRSPSSCVLAKPADTPWLVPFPPDRDWRALSLGVAVAGLATRVFFDGGLSYCPSELFLAEPWTGLDQEGGHTYAWRQIDGYLFGFATETAPPVYRFPLPHHRGYRTPIDWTLADATVLALEAVGPGDDLWQAVESFVLASHDAPPHDRPEVKIVGLRAALERLTRTPAQRPGSHLRDTLQDWLFDGTFIPPPSARRRTLHSEVSTTWTVVDHWVRDLNFARGKAAHGHVVYAEEGGWSINEHAVLASHIFPLALRRLLIHRGLLDPVFDAPNSVQALPALLNLDHFSDDSGDGESPWAATSQEARERDIIAPALAQAIRRLDATEGGGTDAAGP